MHVCRTFWQMRVCARVCAQRLLTDWHGTHSAHFFNACWCPKCQAHDMGNCLSVTACVCARVRVRVHLCGHLVISWFYIQLTHYYCFFSICAWHLASSVYMHASRCAAVRVYFYRTLKHTLKHTLTFFCRLFHARQVRIYARCFAASVVFVDAARSVWCVRTDISVCQ